MNSSETIDYLNENVGVRQRTDEGFRRWFLNSYFELIVWYNAKGGDLYGFQLCLSRNNFERAFTWTTEYSSSHKVSERSIENGFSKLSTGILQGDGKTIADDEIEKFRRESVKLEPQLRELVLEKVLAYNKKRGAGTSSAG